MAGAGLAAVPATTADLRMGSAKEDLMVDSLAVVTRPPTAIAPRVGKRAALVSVACVLVHVPLLATHGRHHPIVSAGMVITSLACAGCARHLWRGPTARTWLATLVLTLTMLLLHVSSSQTGRPGLGETGSGHHGAAQLGVVQARTSRPTGATPEASTRGNPWVWAMTGLTMLQLLTASLVLLRHRHQVVEASGDGPRYRIDEAV